MRTLSFALFVLIVASPAYADEVRLKNGDRITGVTTSLAGGTLSSRRPAVN
jgi:hypothetical protein